MSLSLQPIEVERSQEFEESTFSIGDMGIVLEILRSKLYSNPIQAFVREVACNGRDANEEAGNGHVPIKIKLPTETNPNCDFIDCGIGINRERMYEVFINYGKSTKRKNKNAIGEFGIGAKTPYAYSNAFTIITVAKEPNGKKYRSTYSAYIDESRCGKLALIKREEVDKDIGTGTIISIPILSEDFGKVREPLFTDYCSYVSHTKDTEKKVPVFLYKQFDMLKLVRNNGRACLDEFVKQSHMDFFELKEKVELQEYEYSGRGKKKKRLSFAGALGLIKIRSHWFDGERGKSEATISINLVAQDYRILLMPPLCDRKKYLRKIEHFLEQKDEDGKRKVRRIISIDGSLLPENESGKRIWGYLFPEDIKTEFNMLSVEELPDPPKRVRVIEARVVKRMQPKVANSIGFSDVTFPENENETIIYAMRNGNKGTLNIPKDLKEMLLDDVRVGNSESLAIWAGAYTRLTCSKELYKQRTYFFTKTDCQKIMESGDERFITWKEHLVNCFENDFRARRRIMRFCYAALFNEVMNTFGSNAVNLLDFLYEEPKGKDKEAIIEFWLLSQFLELSTAVYTDYYSDGNLEVYNRFLKSDYGKLFVGKNKRYFPAVTFLKHKMGGRYNGCLTSLSQRYGFVRRLFEILKGFPEVRKLAKIYEQAIATRKSFSEEKKNLVKIIKYITGKRMQRYYKVNWKVIRNTLKQHKLGIAGSFIVKEVSANYHCRTFVASNPERVIKFLRAIQE